MTTADPTTAAPATPAATTFDDLDHAVAEVRSAASGWVRAGTSERIDLLDQAMAATRAVAREWATTAQVAKGISRGQLAAAEDWLTGPVMVVRNLRLLRDTVRDIATTGQPRPSRITTRADGRTVVTAHPGDRFDQALLPGFTGTVLMREGVAPIDVTDRMGEAIRTALAHPASALDDRPARPHDGEVAVVLGAGNVSSIPPMDALTQLFGHLRTVIVKLSPVNGVLGDVMQRALQPFVDADLLRFVHGGVPEATHLIAHPDVAAVHVTGSDRTHDAIVFGAGDDGLARRTANDPVLAKQVTSELGNVSPVIVVPGPWSQSDIDFHGDNIASMLVNNAGFNCIAARIIITHAHWNRRARLLDAVRASLSEAEERDAYYPGARQRWVRFAASHDHVDVLGRDDGGRVPFTLLADLDEHDHGHVAYREEAFCGVFGEVGLDAPRSVVDYLDRAVDFANEQLWGTLSASILVHPKSLQDPVVAAAVERAIDRLHYGSVVVNHWSGLAYGTVTLPWGGAPGQPANDIQSGSGFVHNTWLIPDDQVDKSVLRGPFRPLTKPVTFHTNTQAEELGRLLVEFEATRNPALLARLGWSAVRG